MSAFGTITVSADQPAGAARVATLHERIIDLDAACAFAEPQLVSILVECTDARTSVLDPLGADLKPDADGYAMLLRDLASALRGSLVTAS